MSRKFVSRESVEQTTQGHLGLKEEGVVRDEERGQRFGEFRLGEPGYECADGVCLAFDPVAQGTVAADESDDPAEGPGVLRDPVVVRRHRT